MTRTQPLDVSEQHIFFELEWTDKRGGYHSEHSSDFDRLSAKLETLRRPATLWALDGSGKRTDVIGGCEEADGRQDDKRIKWQWWYDRSVSPNYCCANGNFGQAHDCQKQPTMTNCPPQSCDRIETHG